MEVKGIQLPAVTDWLEAQLPDFPPPYQFELVAAGGSNLTCRVTAGNGDHFALRRPPVRARIATAHDMQREYRIMHALRDSAVPVPRMLAYCENTDITGAEFYCMEWMTGLALRDQDSCAGMSGADCRRATESLLDAQVAFHQIDLQAVGLSDLAQHEGYLQRQLRRWEKQVETARYTRQAITKAVKIGRLPSHRLGNAILVSEESLVKYIEQWGRRSASK